MSSKLVLDVIGFMGSWSVTNSCGGLSITGIPIASEDGDTNPAI
jgi:hypothetical protein